LSLSEPARSDSPPEARSELQGVEPSGNLPAPYVSPWQEFGRNLQAMAADLRLRGQELWRRNREGELSVPGFWPRDLAPSFWPLLLVLLLLLLPQLVLLLKLPTFLLKVLKVLLLP